MSLETNGVVNTAPSPVPSFWVVALDKDNRQVRRWTQEFASAEDAFLMFGHWYIVIDLARQVPADPLFPDACLVNRLFVEVSFNV